MQNCVSLDEATNTTTTKGMTPMGDNTPAKSTGLTRQQRLTLFALLDARNKADKALLAEVRSILQDDLEVAWKEEGTSSVALRLDGKPVGKATVSKNGDAVLVDDPEAFKRWVEENYPDEVEYVSRSEVKPAFSKTFLSTKRLEVATDENDEPQVDDDGNVVIVDTKLGLPVPGIRIKKGEGLKSFSITKEPGVDLAAMANGVDFDDLRAPKQIEGDEVIEGETVESDVVDAEVVDDDSEDAAA